MYSVRYENLLWCLALFWALRIQKEGTVCAPKEFTHILVGEIGMLRNNDVCEKLNSRNKYKVHS